jgi:hypothetical protein
LSRIYAFFLIVLTSLVIIGVTNLKYADINDKIQITQEAFAQTTDNISKAAVPFNTNKLEITLKNSQSENSNPSSEVQLITGVTSAGAAIFGGFIGSYLTNRSNRQMEDRKNARQREREQEIESNVRALILHNLKVSSKLLDNLDQEGKVTEVYVRNARTFLRTFHKEYTSMSLEMKSTLFKPEVLTAVQEFYDYFDMFAAAIYDAISRYEANVDNFGIASNEFISELDNLDVRGLKEVLKKAIDLINRNN